MVGFQPSPEHVLVRLEDHEIGLLQSLLAEMETLLRAEVEADPVNRRLFPDAYESEEDSEAYRELVGDSLRKDKLAALEKMKTGLERGGQEKSIRLSPEDADTWLPVLTDLRLAIGTRNDVTEEKMAAEVDPEDPGSAGLLVLHWLGWLQESLLEALIKMKMEET